MRPSRVGAGREGVFLRLRNGYPDLEEGIDGLGAEKAPAAALGIEIGSGGASGPEVADGLGVIGEGGSLEGGGGEAGAEVDIVTGGEGAVDEIVIAMHRGTGEEADISWKSDAGAPGDEEIDHGAVAPPDGAAERAEAAADEIGVEAFEEDAAHRFQIAFVNSPAEGGLLPALLGEREHRVASRVWTDGQFLRAEWHQYKVPVSLGGGAGGRSAADRGDADPDLAGHFHPPTGSAPTALNEVAVGLKDLRASCCRFRGAGGTNGFGRLKGSGAIFRRWNRAVGCPGHCGAKQGYGEIEARRNLHAARSTNTPIVLAGKRFLVRWPWSKRQGEARERAG